MTCSRVWLWMEGWKFKILAWQETNRRWDGPIANSFRENSLQPLTSSDPLNSFSTSSLGHLRRLFTSLLFRLTFLLVTSPLVRSPFPLLHPHGWLVGAVLVFKDLITDSSLILSRGTPPRQLDLHLSSYSTFFLSNLASHAFSSSSFFVLPPACSVSY